MQADPFGNLREWGSALQTLDDLDSAGRLAECQKGLIRILRFRENWRLREAVLQCVDKIETPSDDLMNQVFDLVCDENAYCELRILASRAFRNLVRNQYRNAGRSRAYAAVADRMRTLLQSTQPPIFSEALRQCLGDVQEASAIDRH